MSNIDTVLEASSISPENQERYGILLDISRQSIVILRFYHHYDLLDLILSDSYPDLILYKTQYQPPTDQDLESLNETLFD